MTRRSVKGGHCSWPDTGGCALTKLECDDPANFLSVRQMLNAPVRAHGGSCRWQESVKKTVLGRCTTDGGVSTQCATEVEACPENDATRGFLDRVSECTVETTSFGRCDYGTCVWSHKHCVEDNTWDAFDEACTCDKVQVGACTRLVDGEKESFCAVSEDACDDEQTWIAPQGVKQASGFDCFLCRETKTPSIAPVADEGGIIEAVTAETASKTANTNATTIIVVAIVGAVVALFIIGIAGWKSFLVRRAAKRSGDGAFAKKEAGPPTTDIEISESGPATDMDDASVLSEDEVA